MKSSLPNGRNDENVTQWDDYYCEILPKDGTSYPVSFVTGQVPEGSGQVMTA